MKGTSYDELYSVLGGVVQLLTGRSWWRKAGIQNQPGEPYATLYIMQSPTSSLDVVDTVEAEDGSLSERPWGQTKLSVKVEFFRGGQIGEASALVAATRFANGLKLSARFNDIWTIAGLVDEIIVMDVSAMFRADVEGRTEVRFMMTANISNPLPLPDTGIAEITSVGIPVYKELQINEDLVETITVAREA